MNADEGFGGTTVELVPESEERRVPSTGAVSSRQEADLAIPPAVLESLWQPDSLERLARGYWLYLRRVSLGALRVAYEERARTVVLFTRRVPLLRFAAPEYRRSATEASVTWMIERGLLVAAEGRGSGWLRIEVRRGAEPPPASGDGRETVRVAVEVKSFYPWLRGSGRFARFGAWVYARTQARIHRWVTIGFVRSLARLELPPPRRQPGGSGEGPR